MTPGERGLQDRFMSSRFDRRKFLKGLSAASALALLRNPAGAGIPAADLPEPKPSKLPRWRGFNLLEKVHRE